MNKVESGTIVRAVRLVALMHQGVPMTTQQVAEHLDIAWSSAKYLLEVASLELPLYQEDATKAWKILSKSEHHK